AMPTLSVMLASSTSASAAPTCTVPAPQPAQTPCSTVFDQGHPNGRFSQSPDRTELDVVAGKTSYVLISLTNYIAQPVHITVAIVDVGPSRDATQLVSIVPRSEFSARSWITSPVTEANLQPLEQLKFYLKVTPPLNASVGTNMAGMTVQASPASGDSSKAIPGGAKVAFRFQGLSQLYFTVPGNTKYDTHVTGARVADSFVVGGRRVVEYELDVKNDGNVNDHVGGTVDIRSIFGNNTATLRMPNAKSDDPLQGYLLLRGAKRTIRVAWIDTPRFGYFRASANIKTPHSHLSKPFPAVVILPPWWVIALIIVALLLPFGYRWWQQRRDMQLLIASELDAWDDDDDESY
ncbi:MAG: hypothetical protein H7123_03035, partial [Thermoleophilia bacterium]|nr:hypothetical protein [Thermoleophilia bacterium]